MRPSENPTLVLNGSPLGNPSVGVGVYTLRLIRALLKAGVSFKVLLPEAIDVSGLLPDDCVARVPGKINSRVPELGRIFYWMEKIASFARQHYPEAIFHSPGLFWSARRPARLIVTLHDCIYRRFPFYLGSLPFRRWMMRASEKYAARASVVLTDSKCSAVDLHELAGIPEDRIRILYPWVENRFNPENARAEAPAFRAKYQLPDSFFLYVGGYDYRKNIDFLIQAYAEARRKGTLPPLVLAGSIPRKIHRTLCDVHASLQRAGLVVGTDVLLPGFIADSEMSALYGAAQILVYPSLFEGFGLPPVEAIACGTPVLVADNSSLREVVPSARNRFSTEDHGGLVDLLLEAARSSDSFRCPEDPRFREDFAINAYLKVLAEV